MAALRPTSALHPHPRLGTDEVLPVLTDAEYAGLLESIKADGIMQPLVVTLPELVIIDGHHRWRASKDIGLEQVPVIFDEFRDEAGQFRLGLSLNLDRRHLTGEQKRNAAALLLKDDPKQSDRSVAAAIGVDHKTVGAVRSALETGGEIPHQETRVGQDGVEQKTAKPKPKPTRISERVKRSRKAKPKKKAEPKASADDMAGSIVESAEAKKAEGAMTVEERVRSGMAASENHKEASRAAGVSTDVFRSMRYALLLSDDDGITGDDRQRVKSVIARINETGGLAGTNGSIDDLIERKWGAVRQGGSGLGDLERHNKEAFQRAYGALMVACTAAPKIVVPVLTTEQGETYLAEIKQARSDLSGLAKRIKEAMA